MLIAWSFSDYLFCAKLYKHLWKRLVLIGNNSTIVNFGESCNYLLVKGQLVVPGGLNFSLQAWKFNFPCFFVLLASGFVGWWHSRFPPTKILQLT